VTRSPKAQETAQAKGRKLSNFLCFAVYSANLAFGRAYKAILDAVGLTYTQYIAMVGLSEADEQTVSELGEKLFLESNTLTPILKKLEQTGYISRIRDPADERQVRVSLTAAGRRLLENDLGGALAAWVMSSPSCRRTSSGCATICCATPGASRGKQDET
jgi:DNA-binding MarR family transcriptional regulator